MLPDLCQRTFSDHLNPQAPERVAAIVGNSRAMSSRVMVTRGFLDPQKRLSVACEGLCVVRNRVYNVLTSQLASSPRWGRPSAYMVASGPPTAVVSRVSFYATLPDRTECHVSTESFPPGSVMTNRSRLWRVDARVGNELNRLQCIHWFSASVIQDRAAEG